MKTTRIATFKDFVGELTVTYKRTETFTKKVGCSKDAADFLRPYFDKNMDYKEEFKVLHLNNRNQIVNVHEVSLGSDVAVIVDIKDLVRNALAINVKAVILAHNHPSGGLKFSQADIDLTKKVKTALSFFDIQVLDSVVLTREAHVSMTDESIIF